MLLIAAVGCASAAPVYQAPAGRPDAPFSESVRVGDTLYLAGKLGMKDGALVPGGIQPETQAAMDAIRSVVERNGGTMNNVVKCTVFLADISEWAAMNAIYTQFFPPGRRPARSAVGVGSLARNARVEIECIAVLP